MDNAIKTTSVTQSFFLFFCLWDTLFGAFWFWGLNGFILLFLTNLRWFILIINIMRPLYLTSVSILSDHIELIWIFIKDKNNADEYWNISFGLFTCFFSCLKIWILLSNYDKMYYPFKIPVMIGVIILCSGMFIFIRYFNFTESLYSLHM